VMASLLVVALIANMLMRPVHHRHHMTEAEVDASDGHT